MSRVARIAVYLLPLVASVAAAATITYAPISCGCQEPWQDVADLIGQSQMPDASHLTAGAIQTGLLKAHKGQTLRLYNLAVSGSGCSETSELPYEISCDFWIWEAKEERGLKKGFRVLILENQRRQVTSVNVRSIDNDTRGAPLTKVGAGRER